MSSLVPVLGERHLARHLWYDKHIFWGSFMSSGLQPLI